MMTDTADTFDTWLQSTDPVSDLTPPDGMWDQALAGSFDPDHEIADDLTEPAGPDELDELTDDPVGDMNDGDVADGDVADGETDDDWADDPVFADAGYEDTDFENGVTDYEDTDYGEINDGDINDGDTFGDADL